jgi:DNA repair protein RadA/Sms
VFVNVVGGVRVDEPGCDLAVALAVASASRGVPIQGAHQHAPRACFGELGLTGELRWVGHPERRLQEAAKHGLSGVIAPPDSGEPACQAASLREALQLALGAPQRPGRRSAPARAVVPSLA